MSEQSILKALSVDNVKETTVHISDCIPSRLSGSENGRRMAEYSRDRLAAEGIEARVHKFPGLVSFPGPARLRVTSPVTLEIEANTLGHSEPAASLAGELVYVGDGAYADYEGKDVRGKIILTELSYAPARHEKQRIAAELGAAAAIMVNWGRPDDTRDSVRVSQAGLGQPHAGELPHRDADLALHRHRARNRPAAEGPVRQGPRAGRAVGRGRQSLDSGASH